MMKTHLHYDCMEAPTGNEYKHPQEVMKELGITYKHAAPQSLYDSWQFWDCDNVPDELPPWIKIEDWDPMKFIGHGLSKEDAEMLKG